MQTLPAALLLLSVLVCAGCSFWCWRLAAALSSTRTALVSLRLASDANEKAIVDLSAALKRLSNRLAVQQHRAKAEAEPDPDAYPDPYRDPEGWLAAEQKRINAAVAARKRN